MLKTEWTNRYILDCSNIITCANCKYNDGVVYTSIPPQYKCTITNEFHFNNHRCNVEFAPVKYGYWKGKPIAGYSTVRCSECGDVFMENSGKWNYCPNCGTKMDEVIK